jgi:hypothetical protein
LGSHTQPVPEEIGSGRKKNEKERSYYLLVKERDRRGRQEGRGRRWSCREAVAAATP